jgi:hypothetical protein
MNTASGWGAAPSSTSSGGGGVAPPPALARLVDELRAPLAFFAGAAFFAAEVFLVVAISGPSS